MDEDAAREWSWHRIAAALREEFGYTPATGEAGTDPLTDLAGHFFPCVLERDGHVVSPHARQYRTQLASVRHVPADVERAGRGRSGTTKRRRSSGCGCRCATVT